MKNGIVRLQFIRFVPLYAGVYPRYKLTCFPVGGPFEPMHQPAKNIGIRQLRKRNSTKDYVRIYKPFMQNKPNFRNDKMNITLDITSIYEILSALRSQKTKPIQTQFNPIQTQFKANKAKYKPNQSQKERFCVGMEFKMIYCDLLADFTTLKGANILRLQSKENSDI